MKYKDFEYIMSQPRMSRYLNACVNDTRKAMTLYRLNLKLSQELFTIVSCFEVALRNAIDRHYTILNGPDWLRDSARPGGIFSNRQCGKTPYIISEGERKLTVYTHPKLVAEMDFGFWRYMFARHQFHSGGQSLLAIFPSKPISTPTHHYNSNFIFSELEKINNLRNRLAHHEPVCFQIGAHIKDTNYARQSYNLILQLFAWMNIDEASLLYGLDHINEICDKIDNL